MGRRFRRKALVSALLLLFSVYLLGYNSVGSSAISSECSKDPVIFVHGFGKRSWIFNTLKARLVANGWPEKHLFALNYSDRFGCNKQSARELSVFVDSVLAQTGAERVDIIAFSMGGLSTRYFIKHFGGDEKVRDIITIGSPHHGTGVALPFTAFPGIFPSVEQMIPESDFLSNLNAVDETPGNKTRWTSIWSKADLLIRPPESSILGGAWNIHIEGVGHASLLLDKKQVFPVVVQALTGGGRNDN
jgi:triacylglycerol lipase